MFRKLLIALLIAVTLSAAAAPAYAAFDADLRLPTLEEFIRSVVTGTPGQVVGVYVPEVLALSPQKKNERKIGFLRAVGESVSSSSSLYTGRLDYH